MSQTPDAATFPQSNPESRLSFMQRSAIRRRLAEAIAFRQTRAPIGDWVDLHFVPLGGLLYHHGLGPRLEAIDPGNDEAKREAHRILLASWHQEQADEVMKKRRRLVERHRRITGMPLEDAKGESRKELEEAARVLSEGRADLIHQLGELLDAHPDEFNAITASMVWIIDTITTEAGTPPAEASAPQMAAGVEDEDAPTGGRVEVMRAAAKNNGDEPDLEPLKTPPHPTYDEAVHLEVCAVRMEMAKLAERVQPSGPTTVTLTTEDVAILTILNGHGSKALAHSKIVGESVRMNRDDPKRMMRLSESMVNQRVKILLIAGYVARPPATKKKGVGITEAGRRALKFAPANPTETQRKT